VITLATVDAFELWRVRYLSKLANFNLSHVRLAFGASVSSDPVGVLPRSSVSKKLESWAIVRRYLRDPTFSRFSRTLNTDL